MKKALHHSYRSAGEIRPHSLARATAASRTLVRAAPLGEAGGAANHLAMPLLEKHFQREPNPLQIVWIVFRIIKKSSQIEK